MRKRRSYSYLVCNSLSNERLTMKSKSYLGIIIILLCGLCLFACAVEAGNAPQVIVHHENPNEDIDRKKLKKIFSGEQPKWPSSKIKIQRIYLPDHSDGSKLFFKEILETTVDFMKQQENTKNLSCRSRATPPKQVASEKEMIQEVAKRPGAVGYTSSSDKRNDKRVKYLNVK